MTRMLLLLAVACALMPAESLTRRERDVAMSHLHAARKRFLDAISGLSEAQWTFKPGPDRWSVAEVAEHIAVSEQTLFELVSQKLVKSPAAPEKKAEVKVTDEQILNNVPNRDRKFQAPEQLKPSGRWKNAADTAESFKQYRDRIIGFVEKTPEELRTRFAPHPALGMLDAYQWVLFTAAHSERHIAQIHEVKSDPGFPRN